MVLHLFHVSFGGLESGDEEGTVYWVVVVPLISLAVHEYHDIRKIIVVINDVT